MSLVFALGRVGAPWDSDFSSAVSLENDGRYWHLHPTFEQFAQQTGRVIDLYDNVVLSGADLPILLGLLQTAREALDRQPERWSVEVGLIPVDPFPPDLPAAQRPQAVKNADAADHEEETHEPRFQPQLEVVERTAVQQLVDQLLDLVTLAIQQRRPLAVWGD